MDEPTVSMEGGSVVPSGDPSAWGDFQLLQKVGQGGFGEVYRAWDPTLQREVALKLLLRREQDQEAQITAILKRTQLALLGHFFERFRSRVKELRGFFERVVLYHVAA